MKYILTESQISKIIFKYLDNLNFKAVKQMYEIVHSVKNYRTYFLRNELNEKSEITYESFTRKLFISSDLCDEIVSVFSLDDVDDAEIIIKNWVEEKINKKIDIFKTSLVHPNSFASHVFEINGD